MSKANGAPVDILILGAGWTSTFLIPLCLARSISHAATSRTSNPKPDTIPFEYDQKEVAPDEAAFKLLPDAKTIVITFPITVPGATKRLVRLYEKTRSTGVQRAAWIQLGTTSVWDKDPSDKPTSSSVWSDRHSPINKSHVRGAAEGELLALSPESPTTVLNLCGLWGGSRKAKHWIGRVAATKEALKARGSTHMIHGEDVSRAILAVHSEFDKATGQRWLLTDGRVHDWWDLAHAWGIEYATAKPGPQPVWVQELMLEQGIRALPRDVEKLGKALDSQEFWNTFKIQPVMGRLE
ncbi:hypothetical protein BDW22DRAFT_1374828 [Trametopsis cervina]|nr:hypothetical protein BDW22DRAFT_1374828 [Trametopsis cervina]